jgi:hypothetical protein
MPIQIHKPQGQVCHDAHQADCDGAGEDKQILTDIFNLKSTRSGV